MGVRGDRTGGDRQGCPQSMASKDRDSSFHPAQQCLQPPLACGAPDELSPAREFRRELQGLIWGENAGIECPGNAVRVSGCS